MKQTPLFPPLIDARPFPRKKARGLAEFCSDHQYFSWGLKSYLGKSRTKEAPLVGMEVLGMTFIGESKVAFPRTEPQTPLQPPPTA